MDEDTREAWLDAQGKAEKDVEEDKLGEYVLVEEDFIPLEGDSTKGAPDGMKKRYLPESWDPEEELAEIDDE